MAKKKNKETISSPATYYITSLQKYLFHILFAKEKMHQSMHLVALLKCQAVTDRNDPQRSHLAILSWMSCLPECQEPVNLLET